MIVIILKRNFVEKPFFSVGQNRQFLEEEVKRLEHQLKQAFAEMDMMKGQITTTEEQNEHLQSELNRYRTRLAK